MSGCGGDDGESTAQGPKYSAANEPPKTFIERMANLLETTTARKDCGPLEAINARSYSRFSCPSEKELRASMKRFEVVGAKEYGTGAVVDYSSGETEDGAAILLFVAPDRNWGISRFGVFTTPSTGTSDEESREGYTTTVEEYLAAVRERDCDAIARVAFTDDKPKGEVCESTLAASADLAKRIKANPSAEPEYESGNATYGFFTFETQKPAPENSTISVVRDEDESATKPYVVLDVAPSPTAADQRLVREGLKKQKRKGSNQPETSPSRKAD